ncbi:hypothetical protein [Pedobacter sp. SYSU D00535]|uniref:hypothetical protein n=1 Tax=Pedobacter sp. SYSU D00535 TaxID=2810308 RepID=UPI001A95A2BF|nr:hypothetical protein [Pedobacter sp. SYSU D00535]
MKTAEEILYSFGGSVNPSREDAIKAMKAYAEQALDRAAEAAEYASAKRQILSIKQELR